MTRESFHAADPGRDGSRSVGKVETPAGKKH